MAKRRKKLSAKERLFAANYAALGSESFGNQTQAAIDAGYSEASARQIGCDLMKRPEIRKLTEDLLKEHLTRNNVTADAVLQELKHDQILARQKGDMASAIRADELFGKYLGLWSDRLAIEADDAKTAEIDEARRAEAEAIASIRLDSFMGTAGTGPHTETKTG